MNEYNETRLTLACDALRTALDNQRTMSVVPSGLVMRKKGTTLYTLTASGVYAELENLRRIDAIEIDGEY